MKLFVLLSRVPFPLEKGDKLRAFNQIKYLSQHHQIHLCCLNDVELHPEARIVLGLFCDSLHIVDINRLQTYTGVLRAFLKGMPMQLGYFYHPSVQKSINKLIKEIQPDHIFCQLIRVAEYVRHIEMPKTLDYQDVFSKGAERLSSSSGMLMKYILKTEAKRLEKYEREIFDDFTHKTIISYPDREEIDHPEKDKIFVVPNGVDTDYYTPLFMPVKYDLVFTGNMGYPPNINSVEYLVNEIMPLVLKSRPHTRLLIAGATPDRRVMQLMSPNVFVSGWVDDIRESYSSADIFVAPMQIGTGLQNKLLEAMSMQLPCVSSELANSALKARDGEEILIGHNPEEYAEKILLLLEDRVFRDKIASKGQEFVLRNFNWQSQVEKLNSIICSG